MQRAQSSAQASWLRTGLVCTCAHVVADALAIPRDTADRPIAEVRLDFPFLDGAEASANVEVWVPMERKDDRGDIAVLRLTSDAHPDAQPARLLPMSMHDGDFIAYGFPRTTDVGQYAYCKLRARPPTAGFSSRAQPSRGTVSSKAIVAHRSGTSNEAVWLEWWWLQSGNPQRKSPFSFPMICFSAPARTSSWSRSTSCLRS